MDVELIELVRGHEELYDFANKRYSDIVHKNQLWKQFAEILQKDPRYCKKRWESLRSQFRKICRSRKTTKSQVVQKMKKWRYEDELSFLLPHMKEKSRVNLMDISSDESRESTAEDQTAESSQTSKLEKLEEPTSRLSIPKSSLQINCLRQGEASGENNIVPIPETTVSTLMKFILSQKTTEQLPPKHPLDLFFDGIKESVKAFSPQDQHVAKKKIFEVVSDIEGKYLNFPDKPQSTDFKFECQSRDVSPVRSGPSSS